MFETEQYRRYFEEGRALGMDHAEAADYALRKCERQ
jgi:hypothetical protein